ncbi:hypothetical protein M758_9G028200 [Ceratodon purpureus]|nr:hypothetical protein M758_9G028200 [Ceratodon purpureus]KAG0605058.1 hypothetical protein M758_9G028200 [Ceratodon purpureus]
MATAVMQGAVLPLSSATRAHFGRDSDCFASAHVSLNVTVAVVKNCTSKRLFSRDGIWNGFGGKEEGSRRVSVKDLCVVRCGAEKAAYAVKEVTDEDLEKQVQPDDIRVLATIKSRYNYITVLEVVQEADHLLAGARLLLLDNPGCIHTVYYEHNVLTNSYYDALATVVPLLPEGPVGILGLGAGAVSHIVHHFFPTVEMHGWELDPDIVTIARQFFNLFELEGSEDASGDRSAGNSSSSFVDQVDMSNEDESKPRMGSGKLKVHIGDAVGPDVCVEGGFAGLIVDLFAEGRVIPALQEPETWEQLKARLKPGGRIMVNCGGDRVIPGEQTKSAGQLYMEETIGAIGEVFAGELSTRYLGRKGFNTIAMTGPSPEVGVWSQALPEPLRDGIAEWRPVS